MFRHTTVESDGHVKFSGSVVGPPSFSSPPHNMTNSAIDSSAGQLADLVRSLALEIGESIKASLIQNKTSDNPSVVISDQPVNAPHPEQCGATIINASKLNLVLRSTLFQG